MLPQTTTVAFTHHVQQRLQQFSKNVFLVKTTNQRKTTKKKPLNTVLLCVFKDFKETADFIRKF